MGYNECKKELNKISNEFKNKNEEEICELMTKAYKIAKIEEENIESVKKLNLIAQKLSFIRWSYIPDEYIICESNFDYHVIQNSLKYKFENSEEFLKFIILLTRKIFMNKYINKIFNDINEIDLANSCEAFSELVKEVCEEYQIKCDIVKIDAGFSKRSKIFQGHGYHYFNIVSFEGKRYIVDCSYRQFFSLRRNIPECLGVLDFDTLNLGYYMINSEEKKLIAEKIVKDGFVELTEETFKHYLDGFTLSFRNGLFYETNGGLVLDTPYTYDDYINLLFCDHDLIKYEGRENLGFQKVHLKNPKFEFKIK